MSEKTIIRNGEEVVVPESADGEPARRGRPPFAAGTQKRSVTVRLQPHLIAESQAVADAKGYSLAQWIGDALLAANAEYKFLTEMAAKKKERGE